MGPRQGSAIRLDIRRGSVIIDANIVSSIGLLNRQRSSIVHSSYAVSHYSSAISNGSYVDSIKTTLWDHFTSTGDCTDEEFRNNVMMKSSSSDDNITSTKAAATRRRSANYYQGVALFYIYAASCFLYSISGICMLYNRASLSEKWCTVWPWQVEGWCFIVQGILSYMSDVYTLGRNSYWHCADRCFATLLFFIILTRFVMVVISERENHTVDHYGKEKSNDVYNDMSLFKPIPHEIHLFWLFCLGLCMSVICFVFSTQMTRQNKPKEMMIAHIGWHLFAPVTAIILYLQI